MNFRDEYKKSAESISPDREAMDRMKAAIKAQLESEQSFPVTDTEQEHKKPLPLKRIAYIGGAVAACAVVTVSAFTLLPLFRNSGSITDTSNSSMAETAAADTAVTTSAESAASEMISADGADFSGAGAANGILDSSADTDKNLFPNWSLDGSPQGTIDAGEPEYSYDNADESEDCAEDADEDVEAAIDSITSPDILGTLEDDVYSDEAMDEDINDDQPDNSFHSSEEDMTLEDWTGETFDASEETGEYSNDSEETDNSRNPSEGGFDNDIADETTTEIISVWNDGLIFNNTVYRLDSSVTSPVGCSGYDLIPVTNTVNCKTYNVSLTDDLLYLFDSDMRFIGAYSPE